MSQIHAASRVGIAVAGAAAMLAFGMTGPAQATPSGGANDACPGHSYCPTDVGAPSGNGNATTQPAAGTKGKADAKNPPGQFPDGSDSNNGYECDGNQGIAQGNPAHTGCASTQPPS